MKGIVLAGGRATRLRPLTKITSKQLLPVYDKPMIYYPIDTLIKGGIKEILVIVAPEYSGHFLHLLGSGKDMGVKFSFEIQEEPGGIAQAFIVGERFIGQDPVTLILGDNIFDYDFSQSIRTSQPVQRSSPRKLRFGVVEFDAHNKTLSIEENQKCQK